jgi:beta-lactamase regulating signal transducer with metallopeptidase domain
VIGFSLDDPRAALGALWNGYVVLLHATVFLAGTWLALPLARRLGPSARAWVHAAGLVGMLVVTALCWLPIGWWARVIPALPAAPLLGIGATFTAHAAGAAAPAAWALAALHALWVAGAAVMLGRLAVGWLVMHRVTRRAEPVADGAWTAVLRECCLAVGAAQTVELRRSAAVAAPLTWGVLDPVILLPAGADRWTPEERRLVLLHELAHVRRGDCFVHALAHCALAWYWFHPGAWLAMRALRAAREEACDLRVLQAGARRSDYAECLMRVGDLARAEGGRPGAVASLAMARPSRLHRRLHRVLAAPLPPRAPRRLVAPAVAAAVAWALLLGSVRLAPQRSVMWEALGAREWPTRAYAASVLSRSRFADVRAELRERAAGDPHPLVRRLARRTP